MTDKPALRRAMRDQRRAHVAALSPATSALILSRPPGPVAALVPPGATVGLYRNTADEAPTGGYTRFFAERGHPVALPWFAERHAAMQFRQWADPFDQAPLERGPYGADQPPATARIVVPSVVFVPLIAFTARGERLGQGGGHYDRWLAQHPEAIPIGLAWDVQELPEMPCEAHDRMLSAIVTPTRLVVP
ncbi:5-formyltetrahydrofolate cyclo-ligase [Parablastomonas sp. CN1-191]|uniref:5-formyltetrahydrofolate cyclo-ligase n=1 Tax=Parablastomonas sp. CN1-191 TaxID=3400908 RepID=UPI003BF83E51